MSKTKVCKACHGTGKQIIKDNSSTHKFKSRYRGFSFGKHTRVDERCPYCHGTGLQGGQRR